MKINLTLMPKFFPATLVFLLSLFSIFSFLSTKVAADPIGEANACILSWNNQTLDDDERYQAYMDSGCDESDGGNCSIDDERRVTCKEITEPPGGGTTEGCVKTSFSFDGTKCVPKGDTLETNPIYTVLITALNFLAAGVGIVSVGVIIFAGFRIVNADGKSQDIHEGVNMIVNTVVGLLLFFAMYTLINFLVPGGLFN